MFQSLAASGPRPALGPHRYLVSAGLHAALIVAAIAMTSRPPSESPPRPFEQAIPFQMEQPVRTPVPDRSPPSQSSVDAPVWQPDLAAPDIDPSPLATTTPTVSDLLRNAIVARGATSDLRAIANGSMPPGELTAAAVDDPVEILEQPEPRYPPVLAQAGIAGRVELSYVVDTVGRVEPGSLRTLRSDHPAFERAARASVLASRYRPARLRERVVRQLVRQAFIFRPAS